MPFVRYARDRRGYETLYVMHAFEGAEKPSRVRVLYACRTVPHAKVGRNSLDEGVQRRIEQAYPALKFEWPKLLKEAAASAPRPERTDPRTGEPRGAQRRERKGRPAGGARPQGGAAAGRGARPGERGGRPQPGETRDAGGARGETSERPAEVTEPPSEPGELRGADAFAETAWVEQFETEEAAESPEGLEAPAELEALEQFEAEAPGASLTAAFDALEELDELRPQPEPPSPHAGASAAKPEAPWPQPEASAAKPEAPWPQSHQDEHDGPVPATSADIGPLTVDRSWPVVALLGADRVLVLRGRYIELAHRVLSRVSSPADRLRLMREASRLNPESWRTEQQARTALATLETAYARLAEQLRQQPRA